MSKRLGLLCAFALVIFVGLSGWPGHQNRETYPTGRLDRNGRD